MIEIKEDDNIEDVDFEKDFGKELDKLGNIYAPLLFLLQDGLASSK